MSVVDRPIVAINYYFGPEELQNRVFSPELNTPLSLFLRQFRGYMAERGIDVVTLDMVDFNDPRVKFVLYFEYNWRMLSKSRDPYLEKVPFEKRALVLIEPAIVNPTLYYIPWLRNRFSKVFVWDLRLLRKHPDYYSIRVPIGADPEAYVENRFSGIPFEEKKLLVSVSSNRWHYMPQARFGLRRKVYRYLQEQAPDEFDLFGRRWDRPCSRWEKFLHRGYTRCWRGEIPGTWDEKVSQIAHYRFSLCFENSVGQPGYLSEKIFDCFCARSVPIYLGSRGNEAFLPEGAYVDWRQFRSPADLLSFLRNVGASEHADYLRKIDRFMQGDAVRRFWQSRFFAIFVLDFLAIDWPMAGFHRGRRIGRNMQDIRLLLLRLVTADAFMPAHEESAP